MSTQALVLADRKAGQFDPLAADLLPALAPIAGKPVLQHCIEDLWEAGIREVSIAVPAGDRSIRRELGDGQRFGLELRYVETTGQQWPSDVLALPGHAPDSPLLVARGDVLRGRCAAQLLHQAAGIEAGMIHATSGARPVGMALLKRRSRLVDQLDWTVIRRGGPLAPEGSDDGRTVSIPGCALALLDSLQSLYDASLAALDDRYPGLIADGRRRPGESIAAAPRTSIARSVLASGVARLGRGAVLHDAVELAGRVEIGDRCVIDEGAQLIDSVVLPGTYVGRGVRLQNALARGSWLYRLDLGTCQRVEDPLLLAGPLAAAA